MSYPYKVGDIIKYKTRAEDAAGNGIGTAILFRRIWRDSDNKFFNGSTWQTNIFNIPMIPNPDAVNFLGFWDLDFDTGLGVNNLNDTYNDETIDTSGNAKNAPWEFGEALVVDWISKLLGINHDNTVVEGTTFINGEMTVGDVYHYASALQAENNGKVQGDADDEGLIHHWHVNAPIVGSVVPIYTQTVIL